MHPRSIQIRPRIAHVYICVADTDEQANVGVAASAAHDFLIQLHRSDVDLAERKAKCAGEVDVLDDYFVAGRDTAASLLTTCCESATWDSRNRA